MIPDEGDNPASYGDDPGWVQYLDENARNLERLGQIADRVGGLAAGLSIPEIPPEMHVKQSRRILLEIESDLRDIYINLTGENPWAGETR